MSNVSFERVQSLSGVGKVYTENSELVGTVQYQIEIIAQHSRDRSDGAVAEKPILHTRAAINPSLGHLVGKKLSLELSDGRKIGFYVADPMRGTIQTTGPLC